MRPQLKLTSAGISELLTVQSTPLVLENFVCGSSFNTNGQSMQTENPFPFAITFQKSYIKGESYEKDGVTVIEDYNHIKVMGYLSSSDITFDEIGEYTVREIALIGYKGSNDSQRICIAYGFNEEGLTLYEGSNEKYIIKLDIICENTPNITNVNSTGYVTYNDFLEHKDTPISEYPVHGITYENNDLRINNNSLDIFPKSTFNKIIGTNIVNALPEPETQYLDTLFLDKTSNSLYKCVKSTELEIGDYIYDNDGTWTIGDGTETGALEIVADSATPSASEIKLTEAQNYFMEWNSLNNIHKRLSLVEDVSLGGITDIINNLQNQINTLLNAQQSPFPAWKGSTTYAVGDICIVNTFKSYQYLECVVAGESSATMPSYVDVGQMVTDNEVKWLVCDFRDSAPVGTYKTDVVQRKGWLKANGATVNRADYPRLWAWVEANSLSISAANIANNPGKFGQGDGSTTFTMPNFEDYFIRYSFTRTRGTVQASQMAQHNHSCGNQDTSHTHTLGNQSANHKHSIGNQSASHQHTINDNTAEHNHTSGNQSASHNHTYTKPTFSSVPVGSTSPVVYTLCTGSETKNTGNQSANHNHTINNKSITHKHTMGNQDTSHTHTLGNQDTAHTHSIGNQSASHKHSIGNTGSGDNTYPTNLAMQMYIKY